MLAATENLRRIQTFRDEHTRHRSIQDREKYFARKTSVCAKRKATAPSRIGAWEGFPKQTDVEREENARVVRGTN